MPVLGRGSADTASSPIGWNFKPPAVQLTQRKRSISGVEAVELRRGRRDAATRSGAGVARAAAGASRSERRKPSTNHCANDAKSTVDFGHGWSSRRRGGTARPRGRLRLERRSASRRGRQVAAAVLPVGERRPRRRSRPSRSARFGRAGTNAIEPVDSAPVAAAGPAARSAGGSPRSPDRAWPGSWRSVSPAAPAACPDVERRCRAPPARRRSRRHQQRVLDQQPSRERRGGLPWPAVQDVVRGSRQRRRASAMLARATRQEPVR